jgi:hypothetical protein
VTVFYVVALGLPLLVAGLTAFAVKSSWRAAKLLTAVWALVSLAAIGIGALAALAVSIARATTPGHSDPTQALTIVLVLIAAQAIVGFVLWAVLRRRGQETSR